MFAQAPSVVGGEDDDEVLQKIWMQLHDSGQKAPKQIIHVRYGREIALPELEGKGKRELLDSFDYKLADLGNKR